MRDVLDTTGGGNPLGQELSHFFTGHGSTGLSVADAFVDGSEGFRILIIEDGNGIVQLKLLYLRHRLMVAPMSTWTQTDCRQSGPRPSQLARIFLRLPPHSLYYRPACLYPATKPIPTALSRPCRWTTIRRSSSRCVRSGCASSSGRTR